MKATTEAMTLQSYFEDVFLRKVLVDVHEGTRRKYLAAVKHASNYAERSATLADLSDKFISGLSAFLKSHGMSDYQSQCHRQKLRALAADAQKRGHKTGWLSSQDPLANNVGGNRRQQFKHDTRGPKAKTRRMLAKAAAMFANGFSMAEIANQLATPKETIHTWKTRYRAVWTAAYERATTSVIAFAQKEATLRAESIRKTAYLQRATAADAALREQGKSIAVDDGDPDAGKTVRELIADMSVSRAWVPTTLRHYHALLRRIERWSGRVLYCRDFSPEWVNKLLAEAEASHLASASVRGLRVHILALWRASNEAGLCSVEPRQIRRVKLIQAPPCAWLHDEVERAVAVAAKARGRYRVVDPLTGERFDVDRAKVLRLAVRVLWDTALRPGDAFRLKLSDVAEDGLISITQGKTGRWHVTKIHASTLALARSIKRTPGTRLIPWDSSYEYFRIEFRERVIEPSGLEGSIKKFRKSSATDVEIHHPGMGAVHLGHRLTANIAYSHYLDPRVAFRNRAMPTELTADLQQAQGGAA